MSLLLVALGGAAGSVARHLASIWLSTAFPWGTLTVNLAGSALIGLAAGLSLQGEARLLLVTGFLGGFTTFSAFSLDTLALAERQPLHAALYITASVAGGVAACWIAFAAVRR